MIQESETEWRICIWICGGLRSDKEAMGGKTGGYPRVFEDDDMVLFVLRGVLKFRLGRV